MRVLDAGVFVDNLAIEGVTTPGVAKETEVPNNIPVMNPKEALVKKVEEAARKTGDLDVLSRADKEVLALAVQTGGVVVTNDFAVQNVASRIGIGWEGVDKAIRSQISWEWYCPACWKRYSRKTECEVCGTETKRRPKRKSGVRPSRR